MADLSKLKDFVLSSALNNSQMSELLDIVKQIQKDTINDCRKITLERFNDAK